MCPLGGMGRRFRPYAILEAATKNRRKVTIRSPLQNERLSIENKLTFVYFVVGFPAHHFYRFYAAARLRGKHSPGEKARLIRRRKTELVQMMIGNFDPRYF